VPAGEQLTVFDGRRKQSSRQSSGARIARLSLRLRICLRSTSTFGPIALWRVQLIEKSPLHLYVC
jgi:hypothetical protein